MSEENVSVINHHQQQSQNSQEICRKFLWGTCTKYSQCKFKHDLVFEDMLKNLKFCHDFQNLNHCSRPNCNYLHASKDEQMLFETTGQLPRVLAERHAQMAEREAEKSNQMTGTDTTLVPAPTALQNFQPSTSYAIRCGLMQPPPPPPNVPPPPPPPMQNNVQNQPSNNYTAQNVYSGATSLPLQATYSPIQNQLPIDTSRPPPPYAGHNCNGDIGVSPLKRNNQIDVSFGPAKMARSSTLCESCVEWEKRLEESKRAYDEAMKVEADLHLLYKKQLESYHICKGIFYSKLPKLSMQQKIEDLLENMDISAPSTSNGLTRNDNIPMEMLKTLLSCVFSEAEDSSSSHTIREEPLKLRQPLGQLPPWSNNEVQMVPNFEPSVPPPTWVPTLQGYQTTQASRAPLFPSTSYQVRSPNSQNTSQSYSSYFAKYK